MRHLTQTERLALANIWMHQPCTAYLVRKKLAASPVQDISDSAGSIYPAIDRLIDLGLVSTKRKMTGRRAAVLLSCTKLGEKALRSWLWDLDARTNFPQDPLRTKMIFLRLLSPAERKEWVSKARRSLKDQLAVLADYEKATEGGDLFLQSAHANSRMIIQSRQDWLAKVKLPKS